MRVLLLSLFILISSCSKLETNKSTAQRIPAAQKEQWRVDIGDCFKRKRNYCSKKHPYTGIKKRWLEFEYQYLNRRNKVHILYNDCVAKGSLQCSKQYGKKETVKNFERLYRSMDTERSLREVQGNTLWGNLKIPFMDLKPSEIKKIWKTVHLIKKAYIKIRDNVFYGLGFAKDKSLDSMHGLGISASGSALVGIGGTIQYEAVIHNHKMALFCAPGITLQSDIGISADVGVFKTLGCKDNKDYQGKFLTFAAGVSGEAVGLPFNIGANYALGMGISEFLEGLAREKRAGNLSLRDLTKETALFAVKAPSHMRDLNIPIDEQFSYLVISKMLSISLGDKNLLSEFNMGMKDLESFVETDGIDKTWKIRPLAHHIKAFLKYILLVEEAFGMDLDNFKLVVNELAKSISSCDAIGLTGGVSLTLSPVNIGMIIYQYNMMTEINFDDVFYLSGFAPKTLLTLNLGPKERERFTKAVAGILKIIPDLWNNQCMNEAFEKFSHDGMNLWDILQPQKK